jgi:hypothetical protein
MVIWRETVHRGERAGSFGSLRADCSDRTASWLRRWPWLRALRRPELLKWVTAARTYGDTGGGADMGRAGQASLWLGFWWAVIALGFSPSTAARRSKVWCRQRG